MRIDMVEPGSTIQKLADGFKKPEGPAVDSKGDIFFSDIGNNRIHKWSVTESKLSVFREESLGILGLYFGKDNNLYACQRGTGRIVSLGTDGKETVLVKNYNGIPFTKANDLWVDQKGGVYFTSRDALHESSKQTNGYVFYISPDQKNVRPVADGFTRPNGIIGSKDGKALFVSDRREKKTYTYRINPNGTLSNKKLFANVGSDGMTLDEKGNLYVTTDAVYVFDTSGQQVSKIDVPEKPSNLCFGGKDGKTLFITAGKGFYSVKMSLAGMYVPNR